MEYRLDAQGEARLAGYFDRIGEVLANKKRREAFATYAMGLMGDGERKSAEPMAARSCPDPEKIGAAHNRMTYFTRNADWSDEKVRLVATQYAIAAMTKKEPVSAWIIDDTGFLKQGTHSVGVQRQYTGSVGKVANCQVGVSLTVATANAHVPTDFRLYLPESWTESPERRSEAQIPEDITFKTKPELALEMISKALENGVSPGLLLADAAYGNNAEFRRCVRIEGLDYAMGVQGSTTVWQMDSVGRTIGEPVAIATIAGSLGRRGYRKVTWRQGSKKKLSSHFAFDRVVLAQNDGYSADEREVVWLVMEWRPGEEHPTHFTVATLPDTIALKELVLRIKERWRTERVYEDAKGELGLDHFEGRSYRGWHHHVSVVICCFAFIVAERLGAIPPCTENQASASRPRRRNRSLDGPSRAPLPKLIYNHPPRGLSGPRSMATSLPAVSP